MYWIQDAFQSSYMRKIKLHACVSMMWEEADGNRHLDINRKYQKISFQIWKRIYKWRCKRLKPYLHAFTIILYFALMSKCSMEEAGLWELCSLESFCSLGSFHPVGFGSLRIQCLHRILYNNWDKRRGNSWRITWEDF